MYTDEDTYPETDATTSCVLRQLAAASTRPWPDLTQFHHSQNNDDKCRQSQQRQQRRRRRHGFECDHRRHLRCLESTHNQPQWVYSPRPLRSDRFYTVSHIRSGQTRIWLRCTSPSEVQNLHFSDTDTRTWLFSLIIFVRRTNVKILPKLICQVNKMHIDE